MLESKCVISLNEIAVADRLERAKLAAEYTAAALRERFPEAQGTRFSVKDEPRPQEVFRREIRLRRGINWGLYVVMNGTDRSMAKLELCVGRESRLTTILTFGAFVVGYGLFWFVMGPEDIHKQDLGAVVAVLLFGLVIGVALSAAVRYLSAPLEGFKSSAANDLFNGLRISLTQMFSGAGKDSAREST